MHAYCQRNGAAVITMVGKATHKAMNEKGAQKLIPEFQSTNPKILPFKLSSQCQICTNMLSSPL